MDKIKKAGSSARLERFLRRWRWPLLGMLVPFVLLWIAYAWFKTTPFGDQAPLVVDGWHQYYPFLLELREKLRTGGSLLHSWRIGMGTNFLALAAYYCASPLNLLTLLVPVSAMRFLYTLLISLKIALAGFFCSLFLQRTFDRDDLSVSVFGWFYALCAFFMGYYWNIMWLDSVALLPLVALGTVSLVREGKWKLYVASLALALFCNYLIGLYVCIFVFFAFFIICYGCGLDRQTFAKRFLQIAGYTLLGLALAAVLLLPAVQALGNTSSSDSYFPSEWKLQNPVWKVIAAFGAFAEPTTTDGLPNLYTGLPCVLLGVLFLFLEQIPRRVKAASMTLLGILLASINVNTLEFIWNGFRDTNMLPYRFSFLVSFVLIGMAFQAVPYLDELRPKHLVVLLCTMLILLSTIVGLNGDAAIANGVLLVLYILLPLFLQERTRPLIFGLLAVLICVELLGNTMVGVKKVGGTGSSGYPWRAEEVQPLLEQLEQADTGFYRVEVLPVQSLNDPALLGYRGVSVFSSTANSNVSKLMEKVGVSATSRGNRYFNTHVASPVTNALFSLKYLLIKDRAATDAAYLEPLVQREHVTSYRNKAFLPVGFMAEEAMGTELEKQENVFLVQNELFAAATGLTEPVFEIFEPADESNYNLVVTKGQPGRYRYQSRDSNAQSTMQFDFVIPRTGQLYLYIDCDDASKFQVTPEGGETVDYNNHVDYPYVFCAGSFEEGTRVTVRWTVKARSSSTSAISELYAAMLDTAVFDAGYSLLEDEGLQVTAFTDTSLAGTITVKEDGYFYTSVPYEAGWKLYVDGKRQEITPWQNAFVAMEGLTAGTHVIELRYSPAGFVAGGLLTAAGVGVYTALCLLEKRKKKKA